MDNKDETILRILIRNSRTPIAEISRQLNISEAAVRKRIIKLEKTGIIKAYTAIIDPFFMNYLSVALVGVDTTPESLLNVFERIKQMQNVRYAALTSGDHMMIFEVWCKDNEELNTFINTIRKMDGVARVCPAIFLRRVE